MLLMILSDMLLEISSEIDTKNLMTVDCHHQSRRFRPTCSMMMGLLVLVTWVRQRMRMILMMISRMAVNVIGMRGYHRRTYRLHLT